MTDLNTMADKRKIGIFGGAFNPVHSGHIKLAKDYIDFLKLDKLLLVPTAVPPHKESTDFASRDDRFNMLSLAFENMPMCEISDIEFRRDGKSYTYDTLIELKKIYPDDEFYLIVGADQFLSFGKWYRYKDILDMVNICTAAREDENEKMLLAEGAKKLDGLDLNKFYLSPFDVFKISSSQIRNMLKNSEETSYFIPKKVYDYIVEKGIYSV